MLFDEITSCQKLSIYIMIDQWTKILVSAFWRWQHKYVLPKRGGVAPFFQVTFICMGIFYVLNYHRISKSFFKCCASLVLTLLFYFRNTQELQISLTLWYVLKTVVPSWEFFKFDYNHVRHKNVFLWINTCNILIFLFYFTTCCIIYNCRLSMGFHT